MVAKRREAEKPGLRERQICILWVLGRLLINSEYSAIPCCACGSSRAIPGQQARSQHILVAGHSSPSTSPLSGTAVPKAAILSHPQKWILPALLASFETLGLNNSLVRQKWAKNRRRARAPRPSRCCGQQQRDGCLREGWECIHFLLPILPALCQQPQSYCQGCCRPHLLLSFVSTHYLELLPMNVSNIFWNLLMMSVNSASCSNEFWKFPTCHAKRYLLLSLLHWSPRTGNEYCRTW